MVHIEVMNLCWKQEKKEKSMSQSPINLGSNAVNLIEFLLRWKFNFLSVALHCSYVEIKTEQTLITVLWPISQSQFMVLSE